jgi:hypothetical protein
MTENSGEKRMGQENIGNFRVLLSTVKKMIAREEQNYDKTVNVDPASTVAKKSLPVLTGLRELAGKIEIVLEFAEKNMRPPEGYSYMDLSKTLREIVERSLDN